MFRTRCFIFRKTAVRKAWYNMVELHSAKRNLFPKKILWCVKVCYVIIQQSPF